MNTPKMLLLLGGSRYLLPVIETAHRLGCRVITCDYLPDNIAHKYADEYCNISVVDKDAVLQMAQEKHIDGIMSFACDPGVVTAAYVAEKMGLPFQGSYEAVSILQDKGKFRKFLADNGFNVPNAKRYTDRYAPFNDIDYFNWPVIVKPTDSAGSKGVMRVDTPDELADAIDIAVKGSRCGAFIIEDFLTFEGYHSSADIFTVDGKLRFVTYSDQLFDPEAENCYTPARIIWPTTMAPKYQRYLTAQTQRLIELLGMRSGIYNVETCVGSDGKPYLMEVSPRGGGCKIAEIQQLAMGPALIENEVRSALGMPLLPFTAHEPDGHWCEMVIHARTGQAGTYRALHIAPEVEQKHVKVVDLSVRPGDAVMPFTGANAAVGDMFLHFTTRAELDRVTGQVPQWLEIELEADM